jgi:hypothetical protein
VSAKSKNKSRSRRGRSHRAPIKPTASAAGPVTLAQAQAIAHVRKPSTAIKVRATRGAASQPATPAAVGLERRKLRAAQQRELRRRVSEYKATLDVLDRRGATNVPAGSRARPATARKVVTDPLRVLAEGDSWFDYPVPFFGGSIIPRLQKRLGLPILNLADAGDEVRFMLGVEQREKLFKHLQEGNPAGVHWDVLLFSGGGNDIVSDPMVLWIRDFSSNTPPANHIHQARLQAALDIVRAGYEDLIEMRDRLSPDTTLILHAYDFAIPDGRGICNLGPWLKPTFDFRKFPTRAVAFEVVKAMLMQFAAMLNSIAAAHSKVAVIDSQNTLNPVVGSWHNELHPEKLGFERFAAKFYDKLKALFPARVL